ncbi:MAG: molybdate ABC transporter substrate-binding protein [Desulfomonilaceae bacterium]
MIRFLIAATLICNLSVSSVLANSLTIAAGIGYKHLLQEIVQVYQNKTGHKMDQVYGDMNQVMTQARSGDAVSLILGERDFLKASDIEFTSFHNVGKGILVVVYSNGVKLDKVGDLSNSNITKVAMADPKKTIYGKATKEFLQNTGLYKDIEQKLVLLTTCPKIVSAIVRKDIEAGFINLTEAIYLKDKIGGYIIADREKYKPVNLVIGVIQASGNRPETLQFIDFLQKDPEAENIFVKSGLR